MPNVSCLREAGKKAVVKNDEHEIEGGCPVNGEIESPVTIEKLAASRIFDRFSPRCKQCQKNLKYRRCMPIYHDMSFEEKMRIDAIIDSVAAEVNHTVFDCPHRVPISSVSHQ